MGLFLQVSQTGSPCKDVCLTIKTLSKGVAAAGKHVVEHAACREDVHRAGLGGRKGREEEVRLQVCLANLSWGWGGGSGSEKNSGMLLRGSPLVLVPPFCTTEGAHGFHPKFLLLLSRLGFPGAIPAHVVEHQEVKAARCVAGGWVRTDGGWGEGLFTAAGH